MALRLSAPRAVAGAKAPKGRVAARTAAVRPRVRTHAAAQDLELNIGACRATSRAQTGARVRAAVVAQASRCPRKGRSRRACRRLP